MFPWNLFPFDKDMKKRLQNMKPEEVDHFIQGVMGKFMPSHLEGMTGPHDFMNDFHGTSSQATPSVNVLNSAAFETHDIIFVRIPIKNDEWLKQIRIYYTSNQLIVENIPNLEDKHTITLPAIVKKKGASAKCKDGILEVKIPKNIDMQYSQIDVSE
jgi:HSP20 family molecular chaperone IbpA